MSATIQLEAEGSVRYLSLRRTARRNALDSTVRLELRRALDRLARDSAAAVVELRAEGPVFSAGVDVKEPASQDPLERRTSALQWQRVLDDLSLLPQVTIAVVNGPAIGAGVMLALSCDLRIASHDAWFELPELHVGQAVAWGTLPRLVRAVGHSRACELVLTGRRVDAIEAMSMGIVQAAVPSDELDRVVATWTKRLASVPAALLSQTKLALAHAHLPGSAWCDGDRALVHDLIARSEG